MRNRTLYDLCSYGLEFLLTWSGGWTDSSLPPHAVAMAVTYFK